MPLLAARTWTLSRAACRPPMAAARRRCLSCSHQIRAPAAADDEWQPNDYLRSEEYWQESHPAEKKLRLAPKTPQFQPARFEAATVIPHSVKQDDDTLLSHIRSLGQTRDTHKFAVVLVTPAFAHKLRDDDFMGRLVYRIFATATRFRGPAIDVDVLCAVVDKLPTGRCVGQVDELLEVNVRNVGVPVAPAGYEGFSYVVLPAECSVPSRSAPDPSDTGAIDFITPAAGLGDTIPYEVLRLPLANTVFQTGTRTTMTLLRYESNTGQDQVKLRQVSRTPLSHHQVLIKPPSDTPSLQTNPPGLITSLSIPLIPLTKPRRVNGCMGNIIRRIFNQKGNEVTAASELEFAVPKFFEARGEPAQAIVAWALIVPKRLHSSIDKVTNDWLEVKRENDYDPRWQTLWRSEPPAWSTVVSDFIARGARLHRVLSGGGGWGQKAGLISLDPVPVNVPGHSLSTDEMPSILADPKDFASTLTHVVNDGDLMQFFTQPASHLAARARRYNREKRLKALPETRIGGWELGTVPSTADQIPGQSWQHAEPASSEASEFRYTFGALTEGPLTLTKRIWQDGGFKDSTSTTTIDVPFARFWKMPVEEYKVPTGNWHKDTEKGLRRDLTEDRPRATPNLLQSNRKQLLDADLKNKSYTFPQRPSTNEITCPRVQLLQSNVLASLLGWLRAKAPAINDNTSNHQSSRKPHQKQDGLPNPQFQLLQSGTLENLVLLIRATSPEPKHNRNNPKSKRPQDKRPGALPNVRTSYEEDKLAKEQHHAATIKAILLIKSNYATLKRKMDRLDKKYDTVMSRLAGEGVVVSELVPPFSDYVQEREQQQEAEQRRKEEQEFQRREERRRKQEQEHQRRQEQERQYQADKALRLAKFPGRFGSSTIYKTLYERNRILTRHNMRLIRETIATFESLGLARPESTASLPVRRTDYRTLNAHAGNIWKDLVALTHEYKTIYGRIRTNNKFSITLTPFDDLHEGIDSGPVRTVLAGPTFTKTLLSSRIEETPVSPTAERNALGRAIETNPIDPSISHIATPPRPRPIRKIRRKPHLPAEILQEHIVRTNILMRLARFAKSLLSQINYTRAITPGFRPRSKKTMNSRAERAMWRGLGVESHNSASALSGLIQGSRRTARRTTRVRRTDTATDTSKPRRVRRIATGRLVRPYVSTPSPTVYYPRRRSDRRKAWSGSARLQKTYVGRSSKRARARAREKKAEMEERKAAVEEKKRNAAGELEELAKSWLL